MKLDTATDVLEWAYGSAQRRILRTTVEDQETAKRIAYCVRVTEIVESYDEGRCGCDTAGNILAAAAQKEGE